MTVHHRFEEGILVVSLEGQVKTEEFASYLRDSQADERFRPEMPRLVILQPGAIFPASPEIIGQARDVARRAMAANARFACVASTPIGIGIASMFMGNAGLSNNYQIFTNESDAMDWLTDR